jgi:hypothetical protein
MASYSVVLHHFEEGFSFSCSGLPGYMRGDKHFIAVA